MGRYFLKGLSKLNHPAILNIKGNGLWIGLELKENTTDYLTINYYQDNNLLIISSEQLNDYSWKVMMEGELSIW